MSAECYAVIILHIIKKKNTYTYTFLLYSLIRAYVLKLFVEY